MDKMLGNCDFAFAYLADSLLKSESHQYGIKKVYKKIRKHCFKLTEEKYEFFRKKIY